MNCKTCGGELFELKSGLWGCMKPETCKLETAQSVTDRWRASLPDAHLVGGRIFEIDKRSGRYLKLTNPVAPMAEPQAGTVIAKDTSVPTIFRELPR